MHWVLPMIWPFANQFAMPPSPIPSEFRKGTLVYASGKGVERCWQSDRKVVGIWNRGLFRQDVEEVIWLSPRLFSRWAGYLAAKEKWPVQIQRDRWEKLCDLVGDKCIFVVRLSAMPKVSALSDDVERPSFKDIDNVRFQLTIGGSGLPRPPLKYFVGIKPYEPDSGWAVDESELEPYPFAVLRGHDRGSLEGFQWWQATPLRWVFGSEFASPAPPGLGSPLGWYRSDWYWVEAQAPVLTATVNDFQFRIFSPSKERIASFDFRKR